MAQEIKDTGKNKKSDEEVRELAHDAMQEQADDRQARGFDGVEVDQTPNENYTVGGQIAGKPTPETDPETKAAATA